MPAKADDILRDYGLLPETGRTPERGGPPAGSVRSRLTPLNVFGQWIALLLFGVAPAVVGLLLLVFAPFWEIRIGLGLFGLAFGLSIGFLIARDVYEWVELDGDKLRWRHLFTRRIDEREIIELEEILTLTLAVKTTAVQIVEGLYGRIKGFEFRFRGMKPPGVRVFRTDPKMTNVRELLEAVVARACRYADVTPEVVDYEGTPLVRRLTVTRR